MEVCTCNSAPHTFIGLDVGTTFSGASVRQVTTCPSHPARETADVSINKFPTRVAVCVTEGKPCSRFLGPRENPLDHERIQRFFKFEFLIAALVDEPYEENNNILSWVRNNARDPDVSVPVPEAFYTFLQGLFDSALRLVDEIHGGITTIITYPSKNAQITSRLVQEIVNMTTIPTTSYKVVYASESEAALLGAFKLSPTLHQIDEPLIVADCGGLTIDTAVFSRLPQGNVQAPFLSSSLGGGLWLDQRFTNLMERKIDVAKSLAIRNLSPAEFLYHERNLSAEKSEIQRAWNGVLKRTLRRNSYTFNVFGGQIRFSRDELVNLMRIYASDLSRIIVRLSNQELQSNLTRRPHWVVMTGGMSMIAGFYDLVQEELNDVQKEMYPLITGSTNAVAIGAAHWEDHNIPIAHEA